MNSFGAALLLIAALVCNAAANLLIKYGMLRRVRLEEASGALGSGAGGGSAAGGSAASGSAAGGASTGGGAAGGSGAVDAIGSGVPWLTQFFDPYFLLGIFCFGLNLLAYSLALKHFRLSLAYPIMVSGGYAIILLVSWLVFREKLTPAQFGGVGFILLGLWMAVR